MASTMLARLWSATIFGVDASLVQVEVDVSFGLPTFSLVGLPDSCVRESRDRVRSAIRNSGFEFPAHRITINLAPADVRKRGTSFDLPIAIGVLAASGLIERREFATWLVLGELSLDGRIQTIRGVLPMALAARRHDMELLLPPGSAREAAIVPGLTVGVVGSLADAAAVFNGHAVPDGAPPVPFEPDVNYGDDDLADVRGQLAARRALEIAAAGRHNVLLVGPPGAGKTLMARRLPGIMPPPTFTEAIETTTIHSVVGLVPPTDGIVRHRPFRAPHHTISDVALVGGGREPRPGEVSLAHNGVLFLDEIPEYDRRALEVLRQPIEEGTVRIARAAGIATFPARFMLVAAMNPCACGYHGDPRRECRCTPLQIDRYHLKLSGPLRDRFDLTVPVGAVSAEALTSLAAGETSAVVRERVIAASELQHHRYQGLACRTNADVAQRHLREHCGLGTSERRLLRRAIRRFTLSARGFDRVRRVARTIADLAGASSVQTAHLAEALEFRGQAADS